jgi:hypothetical protein
MTQQDLLGSVSLLQATVLLPKGWSWIDWIGRDHQKHTVETSFRDASRREHILEAEITLTASSVDCTVALYRAFLLKLADLP